MDVIRPVFDRICTVAESFAFVALRIPGLLIYDIWFRFITGSTSSIDAATINDQVTTISDHLQFPSFFRIEKLDSAAVQILGYASLVFGTTLLLLPFAKLVSVYLHIVCLMLIAASHYLSTRYVQMEMTAGGEVILDDFSKLERHGFHLLAQVMLAVVISCLVRLRSAPARASLTVYVAPIVARMCGFPIEKLQVVHNFSCSFMMLIMAFHILNLVPSILSSIKAAYAYCRSHSEAHGYISCLQEISNQLMLPYQLALFWAVLCFTQFYIFYSTHHSVLSRNWVVIVLVILAEVLTSPVSLLGFCIAVSFFSHISLLLTKVYLQGFSGFVLDPTMHTGYTEGLTMLLLSAQSGLLELNSTQRAFLISIILFIVVSSVLQSMFEILEPILLGTGVMALSASHNRHLWKHFRVLSLCLVLVVFPLVISYCICRFFPIDFWLLVIISSCVLTSVQTLGSFVVYLLFLYDSYLKETWERLDDVIFYTRSVTRVLEFMVAVSVIAYGVRESIFGEWAWTNSTILIIHCYFNVYQRLQSGWSTFLLRREAVKMIEVFPKATKEQLSSLEDVCPICFHEMTHARVTPCGHYFHGACLRKWLFVKQSCPLCHKSLKPNPDGSVEADSAIGREESSDQLDTSETGSDSESDATWSPPEEIPHRRQRDLRRSRNRFRRHMFGVDDWETVSDDSESPN